MGGSGLGVAKCRSTSDGGKTKEGGGINRVGAKMERWMRWMKSSGGVEN